MCSLTRVDRRICVIRLSGPEAPLQPQMSQELRSKPRPVPSPARRSTPHRPHLVLRPRTRVTWGSMPKGAQDATPWSIRMVRTIPKSVQQLFGLDKRLAHAEIVAIQRELRMSRANNSKMARVVQVPFACCRPGFD